ncbi:hypothetical protein K438DRAFT_1768634 [Mycena galopus ATCC 62051]|nr:hypothetical protein K438DRAFT_1768634 [Mycena galopus ATCC 62051]
MKAVGGKNLGRRNGSKSSTSRLATTVPQYRITFDTGVRSEERYVSTAMPPQQYEDAPAPDLEPALDVTPAKHVSPPIAEDAADLPAYATTVPCDEEGVKPRQTVTHMDELKAEESVFLNLLLSLHYHPQLLLPCECGRDTHVRTVACNDCLQAELLCSQCWVNKHRTMPTHWGLVWNVKDRFFEKRDFCRVRNAVIVLGHHGLRCPQADVGRSFNLVESNGIHSTAISFCRCRTADGARGEPEFQQLLRAGIFPGSVKEPKTGYTLGLLEYYCQERNQGKGSDYNFVHVLKRMADPFFEDAVPDIYTNFLAITRFHQHLDVIMQRGHAHGLDVPLPGESSRPYPNCPINFLGLQCAACPERGVNMPFIVNVPTYLRHLISQWVTLDGNYKANLFYKRDDGSDMALTDGRMYFPKQTEFEEIAKLHVVNQEDTHFGHYNSPPHNPESRTPMAQSYDGYCSFVVNMNRSGFTNYWCRWRAKFQQITSSGMDPDVKPCGRQCTSIAAPTSTGRRRRCFGHSEPARLFHSSNDWGARHDTINFVMDAWNTSKVLRQARLLADERLNALRLFELHMAVVEDLSRQHATEVVGWLWLSRITRKSKDGTLQSVYQHQSTKVLTVENVLASMIPEERTKMARPHPDEARTPIARWIHDGITIERQQTLVVALLDSHRGHPLEETWTAITKLRDAVNVDLKNFREKQRSIYPHIKLSTLDVDEPELTVLQLPSYRMTKNRHEPWSKEELEVAEGEVKLRCSEAQNGILAVQDASLALSAVKRAREQDYRGQAGVTHSHRNIQKAELMKTLEITVYNMHRTALIRLGHMAKDAVEPFPPLTYADTWRKETHLHCAKGDSRLFDGTAWYLQSGTTLSSAAVDKMLLPVDNSHDSHDDDSELLMGTQTLKRKGTAGHTRSPRKAKWLKDIAPDDTVVEPPSEAEESDLDLELSPSKPQQRGKQRATRKKAKKKTEGGIWLETLTSGLKLGEGKLAVYKEESNRVQWFRAEVEMYRWLEQYECKHAELMRVIERFRRDSEVWSGLADREEQCHGVNGAVTFGRMQAAMYRRLENNARVIFKSADSGAHADWVRATTFDELVAKIDGWRDVVFKWMDELNIHRAYKDFKSRPYKDMFSEDPN